MRSAMEEAVDLVCKVAVIKKDISDLIEDYSSAKTLEDKKTICSEVLRLESELSKLGRYL